MQLNDLLAPHNLHFGYRVANEAAAFVNNALELVGEGALDTALDLQLMQKVLPRLHGPKQQLQGPLWQLLLFAVQRDADDQTEFDRDRLEAITRALASNSHVDMGGEAPVAPTFPRTARKLAAMLRTLQEQGFVSFIA